LQEGISLKEIGDLLGHRSAISTGVYAKVNISMLRRVADFDLGGLL
jgi:integrase/recombinase XerD